MLVKRAAGTFYMTGEQFTAVCRALIGGTLPEPADDEAWFLEAKRELLDKLDSVEPPPSHELFELVHHYVSDADIRRKDRRYRTWQDAEFLRQLERYEAALAGAAPAPPVRWWQFWR
jgi:hypothetical protein